MDNPTRQKVTNLETFNKLIGCKNADMQSFGISKLKTETALSKGIDPIDVYPIREKQGFAAVKSNQVIMSIKIQEEFKQLEDKSRPGVRVNGKSACVGLSPDLSRLLTFLERVDNLTIENKMKLRPVVMTIFDMYRPAFLIYTGLNLLAKAFLFVIVIFQRQNWYFVVPFYIIYCIMFIYELIDFCNKGREYFDSLFNYFDFALYPAGMGLVTYVLINNYEFLDEQFNNFLVFCILYLALTRAVSMLRILDSCRYLIMMIMMSYFDMTPFFTVLSFYIIGTASINILLSQTNKIEEDGLPRYKFTIDELRRSIDVIYNWGYGNWEGNGQMNALNFWFYIHTGIFIGLVMFNLLIAIISGTYEEFTENQLIFDLKEIIDMLLEMAEFLNFWRKIREGIFGVSESDKIYLHFLIPSEDANEIEGLIEKFEVLKEEVENNQEKLVEKVDLVQKDMKNMKKSIDKILDLLSKQEETTKSMSTVK